MLEQDLVLLTATDFGDFEMELRASFERAFGFRWESIGPDTRGEAELRERLRRIAAAAHPVLMQGPNVDLLRSIYELREQVRARLNPDLALCASLERVEASAYEIGGNIAVLGRLVANSTDRSPAVDQRAADVVSLGRVWARIEQTLTDAVSAFPCSSPQDEAKRIRAAVAMASGQVEQAHPLLHSVHASPLGKIDLVAKDRQQQIEKIILSCADIQKEFAKLGDACDGFAAVDPTFHAYFTRIIGDLRVQEESKRTGSDALETQYEVPFGALPRRPRPPPAAPGARSLGAATRAREVPRRFRSARRLRLRRGQHAQQSQAPAPASRRPPAPAQCAVSTPQLRFGLHECYASPCRTLL